MKTIVVVLLGLVASANVANAQQAASQVPPKSDAPKQPYTVNGLALGAQVKSGSAAYKGFDCSASELFKGFTWCHKTSTEKKSGAKINSSYSVLRSADGAVVYTNQSSEPSSFTSKEVKAELQSLTQKFGAQPRILNMPRKPEFAEGVIALWGDVALEPLDAASISVLATGKSPGKGLLLDFIGNLRRSAQVGLPVYRLAGGPGFVWSSSYGKKGGGALRSAAVDASAFAPPAAGRAPAEAAAPAASAAPASAASEAPAAAPAPAPAPVASPAPGPATATSPTPGSVAAPAPAPAPVTSPVPGPAPVVSAAPSPAPAASPSPGPTIAAAAPPAPAADKSNERDVALAELNQTIDKLKADLASSAGKIAELQTVNDQADRAMQQAQQARADAEDAKAQAERATIAERNSFDAKTRTLQIMAYAAVAALIAVLAINAFVFLSRRMRAGRASDEEEVGPQAKSLQPEVFSEPIKTEETQTQYRDDLVSENIFGRELERHVARINALQDEPQGDPVR